MLSYKFLVCREIVMKYERKLFIIIVSYSKQEINTNLTFAFFPGESPQFNEAFEFEIAFPELALVRFVVLDDDSLDYDFIGQYTLPFDCIQPGKSKLSSRKKANICLLS